MFKQSDIVTITPKNNHILVKVVIDDFSVFELHGKKDLKGTTIKFYVESSPTVDYIAGDRILVDGDIVERCGGFLSDIDNKLGLTDVAALHNGLNQKDREIFNKNTPRVTLIEFILMPTIYIKGIIE